MKIISRAQWGAASWRGTPYSVALSRRTEFFVHYHGGPPRHDRGNANAKEIEGIHLNNGWSGVGYNFIVGQDGAVREGRGWNLVGAHCPGHNTSGIGVYVAVGQGQQPTDAAKRAVCDLYDEACRKTGRTLAKKGHRDGLSTECPGDILYAWVKAGMPRPGGAPSTGSTVATKTYTRDDVRRFQRAHNLTDDGYWGNDTEKQAQAIRRVVKPRVRAGAWDLVRYWRLIYTRPKGKRTASSLRSGIQWALGVDADGIWGPATDAAWLEIRDQHKMKGI